ncbi:MAG TPA: choice-of-anchor D domain-containing protein [Candidatus Sulfotelmatobacter sp.]|nr:choice-of-anchor D domain-containing protein [Candidatus Sulfotelmatobacter sp.]
MNSGRAQTVGAHTTCMRKYLQFLFTLALIACTLSFSSWLTGCAGVTSSAAKQTSSVGSFQINPASVNFGQVAIGKPATQTVSVSNTGSVGINITQLTLSNSQFSVTGMTTPMALAVGQSGSFTIAVNATSAGTLTGTLTVQGSAGSTPVVVNLSATATSSQSQLSLSASSLSFGNVAVGTKSTDNLVLNNTGTTDLTISMLTLAGSDFTISGITTPKTIAAGQSVTLAVTFTPTGTGNVTGSLAITSSDAANPTVTIPLTGAGSATATGQLSANPSSLSFGAVGTGTSNKKQIVLTNSGNAAVDLTAVTASGAGVTVSGVTLPLSLNPSQTTTLTVAFDPTQSGSVSGAIKIVSNAGNSPLTVQVSGSGAQPGLALTPATYSFGSIVDGQTKSETVTITNTGTAALTIADVTVNGAGFSVSGLSTPVTIAAGSNSSFAVLYAPTTPGSHSGTVSIASNAPNSPNVLALTGASTGSSVNLSANPTTLSFSNVNAGSSSSKNVTVTNSGNSSLTISQITVNAKNFAVSGISTPLTLSAGQSAAMTVSFSPATAENVTGNITLASAQGANSVVTVSGTGVQAGLAVTPASASFGNVTIGSPSSQTIQLANSGNGTLTISQLSVAGSGFSTSTLALPINLAAGQAANFNVQFAPTSASAVTGSVTIVSNAPSSPSVIPLSGTGVTATQTLSFSTTNIGFGNVNAGSSATQPVTITNSGNASIAVSQITASGTGFSLSGAGTPVTLSAGQSTSFNVIFAPTGAGSDSGTVTVTSTANGSPAKIALSGTGVQAGTSHTVTLAWAASTSTVSGYNVYRSTTNGSGYTKINSALVSGVTYSDTTVQSATTYYYVLTAVNSTGEESAYSNQATAVIP